MDQSEIIGAIFFDLKNEFDVVNPEILLKKLKAYTMGVEKIHSMAS